MFIVFIEYTCDYSYAPMYGGEYEVKPISIVHGIYTRAALLVVMATTAYNLDSNLYICL